MIKGTFVPYIPAERQAQDSVMGMFGAVIMPHNLYLHSALVLTRKINMNSKNEVNEANIYNNIESSISLFMSFLINVAVVSTFAVYLESQTKTTVTKGHLKHKGNFTNIHLEKGAEALASLLGKSAKYFWAIGLLASG
jgi:natural resistance-associated macrophage protein